MSQSINNIAKCGRYTVSENFDVKKAGIFDVLRYLANLVVFEKYRFDDALSWLKDWHDQREYKKSAFKTNTTRLRRFIYKLDHDGAFNSVTNGRKYVNMKSRSKKRKLKEKFVIPVIPERPDNLEEVDLKGPDAMLPLSPLPPFEFEPFKLEPFKLEPFEFKPSKKHKKAKHMSFGDPLN